MTSETAALLLSCLILTKSSVYLATNVKAAKVFRAATYEKTRSEYQVSIGIYQLLLMQFSSDIHTEKKNWLLLCRGTGPGIPAV